jgi:F-type H+-transporting ATPase subunit alpha
LPDPRIEATARAASDALVRSATGFQFALPQREEGRVRSVADGVVRVEMLPQAQVGELLDVGRRGSALVLGVSSDGVEAVAVDDRGDIAEGAAVRAGAREATVPIGEPVLSRVVDPLGRPLDGAPMEVLVERMPLERRAPGIHERSDVHRPLFTGTLAIDSMIPIGRGQRELILGDEGTGKTAIALDAIVRQQNTGIVCVYVAIGRRRAEVWRVADTLRKHGGSWIVVAASEDDSPALRYLAPYAGSAMAEYFAYRGDHALVVYDDLSAHANAWRELSLLLRRPPGREAYPGDIFYLHARLLERAAQLSSDRGGGSITALPIATLEGGRLTGYIPTNLISITDGQIVLSHDLFAAGQKPAIDIGLSVSRVGSKAQPPVMRDLAARLKLDYAAFLELEGFAKLGTRLDSATERRLAIGRRIRQLLRAERLRPMGLFEQVVHLVLAIDHDRMLRVPENRISTFASEATDAANKALAALSTSCESDGVLKGDGREQLGALLERLVSERFPSATSSTTELAHVG